ncbi:MAG: hypothetical protein AAFU71_08200 [Cyanobacteria bacterium J06632_22]
MQLSSQLSNTLRRQSSAQSATHEPRPSTPLQQPDSNVMSLVYPDGRVMTIQLQD